MRLFPLSFSPQVLLVHRKLLLFALFLKIASHYIVRLGLEFTV